jgi:ferredoxin
MVSPVAEPGRWQVEVDPDTCIGSGMCVSIAPQHFRLVGDHAQPVHEVVDPDDLVLDAGDSCPVEAILVRERNTSAVLAPSD